MMLQLKRPTLADMPFRQALMADSAITAYHQAHAYSSADDPAARVDFPETAWQAWLDAWTEHTPERFCAMVVTEEGLPVGEVSWQDGGRAVEVLIGAEHRGKGCGVTALRLLTEEAFRYTEIDQLMCAIEDTLDTAVSVCMAAGFVPMDDVEGTLRLRLTRERYEARRRERMLRDCMDAMIAYDAGDAPRIHHFLKVHAFARQIALAEGMDENTLFTLEAAAITHDIGIHAAEAKYGNCAGKHQEELGPAEVEVMLAALDFPVPVIRRVSFLVGHHHTVQQVAGADWQILLEADFLVNMIEEALSPEAIAAADEKLFRTAEGKRLLHWEQK